MDSSTADLRIDELLTAVRNGDREALNELLPLVYEELLIIARVQRERWHGNPTLNATAILNEAYLKLVAGGRLEPESRGHFFAAAARAMRHILCNYARDRQRLRRGGGVERVAIDETIFELPVEVSDAHADQLAALDQALRRLEQINERQSRVVECRFFGGMTIEDTAFVLGLSVATVKRDWLAARTWLFAEIQQAHVGSKP